MFDVQCRAEHVELVFDAVQHRAHGPDLCLSNRPRCLDIDDHSSIGVDQVVGRICKERGTFARSRPLT
jgi:hypothetical protein